MTLKFHSDPGHGWVEAPISLINKLGIYGIISRYSYISKDRSKVYLEEDCDATTLINELEKTGEKIEFEDINYDSLCFIRNMDRCNSNLKPSFCIWK